MKKKFVLLLLSLSSPAYAEPSCTDQVDSAFAKLRGKGAFRMETNVVDPKQGTLHLQADYILPDRMHQKVSLGTDGMTMDTISIGTQAWSNDGEGWRKLPDTFADKIAEQVKETVANPPKTTTEYKCLGDTKFEGKSFLLYQGTLDAQQPATEAAKAANTASAVASNVQNVYVDKSTGLPVRNIVTPAEDPSKRLFDGTFTLVDNLKIDAPQGAN